MSHDTITLADPVVTVDGWTPDMNRHGAYHLRVRTTPEERKALIAKGVDRRSIRDCSEIPRNCVRMDPCVPGRAYFLPGLWPRVRAWLDAHRPGSALEDRRDPEIRPRLDVSALSGVELRDRQDVALAMIAGGDCGIIATTTGFGKSFLIGLLCRAYPTLRILVTTRSKQVVETLYFYLLQQVPGEVGILFGGKDTTGGKRIVVTTLASVSKVPAELPQLVLVDECHEVGDNTYGEALSRFCFARRFGFSASPVRNDGSGRMMEAVLGPVIMTMSYSEATDAGMVTPLGYAMLHVPYGPSSLSPSLPDVTRKRLAYWRNGARNQAIADFVMRLASVYGGQILIMVPTLEHALNLAKLLPWFRVAYSNGAELDEVARRVPGINAELYRLKPDEMSMIRRALERGTLRHVIATKSLKQGVNLSHLSVLIRADGDTSEVEGVQIPGRLSRLDEGKDEAYLIDLDDAFDPWAARRAKAREEQYRRFKWRLMAPEEVIDALGKRADGLPADAAGEARGEDAADTAQGGYGENKQA